MTKEVHDVINISLAGNWQSFGLSVFACTAAVRELPLSHATVMPATDFARIYGTTPGLSAWSPPI
jgi:hypothetical protein